MEGAAKFVLKYFVANMRAKLKIMQRIKNLTSAYPLSATRLACSTAQSSAKCGKLEGDWFAECGREILERDRKRERKIEKGGRQAALEFVACCLPVLIF